MKFDLNDLTFIISYKKDTEDRERNLRIVLSYFKFFFENYHAIVLEIGNPTGKDWIEKFSNVEYFNEKESNVFHKSLLFNLGAKLSTTNYLSFWDTDVICDPGAVFEVLRQLKMKASGLGFCYSGVFLELKKNFFHEFLKNLNFNLVPRLGSSTTLVGKSFGPNGMFNYVHHSSPGGCIFFNKEIFFKHGGYNNKFKKWGFEDDEILERFLKVGEKCCRVGNISLIHLQHDRTKDGTPENEFYKSNLLEFLKIKKMNKEQLIDYIEKELKTK